MQDKIIDAIATYLKMETNPVYLADKTLVEFRGFINQNSFDHSRFCKNFATEIAAAIAPLVEAGKPGIPKEIDRTVRHDDTPF